MRTRWTTWFLLAAIGLAIAASAWWINESARVADTNRQNAVTREMGAALFGPAAAARVADTHANHLGAEIMFAIAGIGGLFAVLAMKGGTATKTDDSPAPTVSDGWS